MKNPAKIIKNATNQLFYQHRLNISRLLCYYSSTIIIKGEVHSMIKINVYKQDLKLTVRELQTSPDGFLLRKGRYYYHRANNKEIGITRKPALIYNLARKRYSLARKEQLENNISVTSQSISNLDKTMPEALIQSLPKTYQDLPITYFYHPSTAAWIAADYQKNPYPFEGRKYITKKGVRVRSKSELLIANLLEAHNIPYRYEGAIILGGKTKFADFIILNPFSGKQIIWEHFGATNLPGYEENMNEKMNLYTKHGYTPFETFIYTFEYEVGDPQRLQDLIENVILGI